MPYTAVEIAEYGRKLDRSRSTLFKWISEGCNLRDDKSVREWVTRNTIRETNSRKVANAAVTTSRRLRMICHPWGEHILLPPMVRHYPRAGKRGEAAALQRLERQEEEAHRRLVAALERNDSVQIAACQDFWLKCSETLRRLDLTVELARRNTE